MKTVSKKASKKVKPTVQIIVPDGTLYNMSLEELGCSVHSATLCASGIVQTEDDMHKIAVGVTRKGLKNLGKTFVHALIPFQSQPL